MKRAAAALGRLVPRRLAGQIIALLLLALVLSQAVSLAFFLDERRLAVQSVGREQVLSRVASVVRLIDETPPAVHRRVVRAANAPLLRFWLAPTSAVDARQSGHRDNPLRDRLARLLDGSSATGILVDFTSRPNLYGRRPPPGRRDGGRHEDREGHEHDGDSGHVDDAGFDDDESPWSPQLLGLAIAIRLADGRWLNAQSALPVPGPAWAVPSLVSMVLMAAALILIVVLMVRRIARPLEHLADAAGRLGRGEAVEEVPEEGPLDVRHTIRAFNRMNRRLDRFVRDRTQMLAAISHDLRTPITALRLRAEFVEDAEARRRILETLDEMQQMAEATLAFAREEATREPTRIVDLSALVDSVCDDLAEMGLDVTFADSGRRPFACRPVALKRALRNLVENAVAYGHRARVALEEDESGLRVIIDDDGSGIPPDAIETVFQPFVRLEESRSTETGGIGLGMAIARSIVRGHGGDVTLENRPGGGLRAVIRLPKPEPG